MMQRMGRFAGLAGATSLVAFSLGFAGPASATPSGAVPFSQANFHGYATGDELHLGVTALNALSGVTGSLGSLDQGLSSASTSTAGLTSTLQSELGTVIQPAQSAAVKAFDLGAGLNVDLGTVNNTLGTLLSTAHQQIPLPVTAIAPPSLPSVSRELGPVDVPPLLHADNLLGQAQAAWPGTACPTGNLSYGLGNLTAASVLTGLPALTSSGINTAPLISTAGTNNTTSVSQSKSLTTLVPNGDGSFGVQTQASDIIAPISLNLLGLARVDIAVHSAGGINDPVTLTATTSGENGVPASLKMSTDDLLTIQLTPAGQSTQTLVNIPLSSIGPNGLDVPLSISGLASLLSNIDLPSTLVNTLNTIVNALPSQLQQPVQTVISQLQPVLGPVINAVGTIQTTVQTVTSQPTVQQLLGLINGILTLNLGSIHVDTTPHAIGNASAAPTEVGGTQAGGALDLLRLDLGLTDSSINIGGQTIPANTIPGVSQAITIPAIQTVHLPEIPLANAAVAHLEATSNQQQPIACTTAAVSQQVSPTTVAPTPTTAPKLPFTGGPGGLWQPIAGVAFLGVGGGALALVRRLRRHTAA